MTPEPADVDWVPILGKDKAIALGFHLIPFIAKTVATNLPSSCYAIVTDTAIAALFLDELESALKAATSSRVISYAVPPGESSKSRNGKAAVEDFLLSQRCTRDTVILALGGGVVGDLTGFVAATFMRGVRYVQIPTTLLAMVDSSVGGKTAIDVPLGKNLIGAFYQPQYIFIDAAFLETLPEREFVNGMAEVIKTAAIWDADSFDDLEAGVEQIRSAVLNPDQNSSSSKAGRTLATRSEAQKLLLSVIKSSISVKAFIVTKDEKETGLRNLVNFGHTIGHAIEAVLTPQILHGECVSVGMVLEAEVARHLGVLSNSAVGRLTRCLKSHGLPVSMSDPKLLNAPGASNLRIDRLLDIMSVDKKNSGNKKKIVLLSRIGKTYEEKATAVEDRVISYVLAPSMQVYPAQLPFSTHVTMSTPGSKSISNRALLLAALAQGTCKLTNLLHSDDTQVMISALQALNGAQFRWEDKGETLVVEGGSGRLQPAKKEIYLGNAGTAARFLTTICTLVQSAQPTHTVITGNKRMKERPIGPLVDALTQNGASLQYQEGQGCLPLSIASTGLKGGKISLAASVSSQYVSSILLAAPYAQIEVLLELIGGTVISQPYIDMTCAMMKSFGIHVERLQDANGKLLDQYRIPRGVYQSPTAYSIESDASSATYPLALAAITGTTCTLSNIGSASLQGDALFAKGVLEPMGCKVVQSETSTTVTGPPPGKLKPLPHVDMEPMTDAFLTATALAAVATNAEGGSTRISGIANQRVKECNRIEAMMTQLAPFGVQTQEHPTGLEIFGVDPEQLKTGARVHCYDDHRVAMAFSVLAAAARGPGAVITEKRCVEKTWPSWWDDLSGNLGIGVEGVEDNLSTPSSSGVAAKDPEASILLVGMRGSGKTYSGRLAAELINFSLIDADEYFTEKTGQNPKRFVEKHGWPAFRHQELVCLKDLLQHKGHRHVLALGGGIVETPEAFELIKAYAKTTGPVVNIHRDLAEVVTYLGLEQARPAYGEAIEDVAARRTPLFQECTSHEFVSHTGFQVHSTGPIEQNLQILQQPTEDQLAQSRLSIARFFNFIRGSPLKQVDLSGSPTYFVALTFPDISVALPDIEDITTGADAIELRVDLLSPTGKTPTEATIPPLAYVGQQLALLRKHTPLPIIFTVRTKGQGGFFPDASEADYFRFLEAALRWGSEYVDVESDKSLTRIAAISQAKGHTKIIASAHDWSGQFKWDSPEALSCFEACARFGDVVKIVGKATSMQDNMEMMQFRQKVQESGKPLITLNMGADGQLSRILNPVLSPITHPAMAASAPGQMTFPQIQEALHLMGQIPAKRFYLFGMPIAHSKSPLLHNTAFKRLGLPHTYGLHETKTFDASCLATLSSPAFGGASVTIPHKLDVMPHLDDIAPEAKVIGAVNTVVVRTENDQRRLVGYNTDWQGIKASALAKGFLPGHNTSGLVIGAGGTARAAIFALHSLGLKTVYLFNRTQANADKLAQSMSSLPIKVVAALDQLPPHEIALIVSTVPADGVASTALPNPSAGVTLPDALLSRAEGGVLIDMAYKPKRTALLALAEGRPQWKTVAGIEVLLQQGYEQFTLWTARNAPKKLVETTVLQAYDAEQ